MIPGATTFKNKYTGEFKQRCECGAIHPVHHFMCMSCGKKQKSKAAFQEVKQEEEL